MIEDIIIDGETGYLINDNDASTIASGITAALSDPRLGEVSEAAEKLVRQKYSFDKKRKAWEQLMSSADKGHSSGNFREGQSYRP
jgi:glycosyltransferase involved in cell wall biosynthesis